MYNEHKSKRAIREQLKQIDKSNLRLIIGVSALLVLTVWAGLTLPT